MERWRDLYIAAHSANSVRQRAAQLVGGMIEVLSDPEQEGLGFEIAAQDDPRVIARFNSPIGPGRMVLNWRLGDYMTVNGLLDVEVKKQDRYDAVYWDRVFQIVVTSRGFYMERDGDPVEWALGGIVARSASEEVFAAVIHMVRNVLAGQQP